MRVDVDMDRCIGSGMCTTLAPELFELDDDGVLRVKAHVVPPGSEEGAEEAVACCPAEAIALEDV
jgi:ferredoxin